MCGMCQASDGPRCLNGTSYVDNHKLAKTTRCLPPLLTPGSSYTLVAASGRPRSKAMRMRQLTHAASQVLRSHAINRPRPILAISTSTRSRRSSSNLSYARVNRKVCLWRRARPAGGASRRADNGVGQALTRPPKSCLASWCLSS
jgi:hypothetical protein